MAHSNFTIKFITIEPLINSNLEPKPVIHNKNSRRNKIKEVWNEKNYETKTIYWRLRKYSGDYIYNGLDWHHQSSAKELNYDELTTENILPILNSKNVFDFDYLPKENDMIWMHLEYTNKQYRFKVRPILWSFISFLYKDNKWTINKGFDHIHYNFEEYKNGIVEFNKHIESS
ncbi:MULTISPECIES: hypothetical protein [Flavobacterium]|uniref:Uncharacterized protein n=1 Tax=Flavobacterium jumunjinense TaxID=998845 RepID=A0ABV5GK46_9FLAO|nr:MULTISPECIES: hypothetical protein [Flavobacterium]